MDFNRLLVYCLGFFLHDLRVIGKSGKCDSGAVFTMFQAHRPLESKRKIKDVCTFSDTFFKMATDIICSSILGRFGLHFGTFFCVKIAKNGD